jgi:hypothetical protein
MMSDAALSLQPIATVPTPCPPLPAGGSSALQQWAVPAGLALGSSPATNKILCAPGGPRGALTVSMFMFTYKS